jgi:hypothetical protein
VIRPAFPTADRHEAPPVGVAKETADGTDETE